MTWLFTHPAWKLLLATATVFLIEVAVDTIRAWRRLDRLIETALTVDEQ